MILLAAKATAVAVVFVFSVYSLRHFFFAFHRLFRPQRMNYIDLAGFHLPSVTVLIPMHNEEAVAHDVLEALLEADYPHNPGRLEIIPIRGKRSRRWFGGRAHSRARPDLPAGAGR